MICITRSFKASIGYLYISHYPRGFHRFHQCRKVSLILESFQFRFNIDLFFERFYLLKDGMIRLLIFGFATTHYMMQPTTVKYVNYVLLICLFYLFIVLK
jgi:hypothetical protein